MLLAHTPVPLPMSPPTSHRRHPSAPPAVVVQPTKVPGILSISKPFRADSPRHHRQPQTHTRHPHRSPRLKHAQPPPPSSHDDPGKPEKPSSDVTVAETPSALPVTPLPERTRGRQSKTPIDKAATRSSSTHGFSRRHNVRQPSPPTHSSQVEGPILSSAPSSAHRNSNPAANSFDPFTLPSDSDSDNSCHAFPSNRGTTKSSPTLAPPPSGKIARRRNHTVQEPVTPTPPPRPVPVPGGKATHRNNLSRSAPNFQSLPRIDKRRASAGYTMDFPVCDDTTDVDDHSSPSTPTREFPAGTPLHHLALYGPRTAPLSSRSGFPFAYPADSTPSRTRHHHHRTPSEGVFSMSFDEDMSVPDASEELKKLFGFPPKRFGSLGSSATRAAKDKAGFFASSVFQNSPSPDELPPPAF